MERKVRKSGGDVFDALKARGFIHQTTDEGEIRRLLHRPGVTFYAGFDSTAESLHAGHLVPIMAMAHLQRAGHVPIALIGGGTAMVGDPSGRTEMRKVLSQEAIERNGRGIRAQLERFLELDGTHGLAVDNAEWLSDLHYIDFLRKIGVHFRVNEMIKAEAYRRRLAREEGLSFLEFNYQLLQAYDFLVLFQRHGCTLQLGGDDQWGNILAGVELIRRMTGRKVSAMTFPLVETRGGKKMGKSEADTVWLDAEKTSPYEFYQYWINVDDGDVARFLALFTFLKMEEVKKFTELNGARIRAAKEALAREVTKRTHGEEACRKAQEASRAAFAKEGEDLSGVPTIAIERSRLAAGISAADLFTETGLAHSKSEARRLIQQGGAYINEKKVESADAMVKADFQENNAILLRHGKKRYRRIIVGDA